MHYSIFMVVLKQCGTHYLLLLVVLKQAHIINTHGRTKTGSTIFNMHGRTKTGIRII